MIAGQTVATENSTADDGLQQIVGEAHTTKDTEMVKCTADRLKGIPGRNNRRDDHQQNDEVVDRLEP